MFPLKRVYDAPSADDGFRVLVDRLWPRGVSKERAALDLWAKEAAPSAQLRDAVHRGDLPWDEFTRAYRVEIAHNPAVAELRRACIPHPVVTLLIAGKDLAHSHATILREALLEDQ